MKVAAFVRVLRKKVASDQPLAVADQDPFSSSEARPFVKS